MSLKVGLHRGRELTQRLTEIIKIGMHHSHFHIGDRMCVCVRQCNAYVFVRVRSCVFMCVFVHIHSCEYLNSLLNEIIYIYVLDL